MLPYFLTYKDEPSAHGRCELEARRSVHPERMQGGALTSIWQVGVPPAEAQGVDSANSLFYKKVRSNILSLFPWIYIQHSTFHHQPKAGGPPFSPERETYGMLLFIQLLHSCLLRRGKSATCYRYSQALTYRVLLSTSRQQRPGCQQYGNQRFHNSMDLQPMTTSPCRHSPFLSRTGNVLHTSVNWLSHAHPLQKRTFHFIPAICKYCTVSSCRIAVLNVP